MSIASLGMLVFKRPGAENAMNKHMTSLLSFDKNKGFTLETGQFVPSCKTHKKREQSNLETYKNAPDGLAAEKQTEAKDLLLRTGSIIWRNWCYVHRWIGQSDEEDEEEENDDDDLDMSEFETCVDLNLCQFKISDMHFALLRTATTSDFDRSCGTIVLCARQLDKPPKLLLSAGTGGFFGGGFGGEAFEVEANICDVLKAAGVEGKLTPSEFLAVLLSACTASEHWQHDLEELADHESFCTCGCCDKSTTPILQDACRIVKLQPVLVTHDVQEEGEPDSESKIMPVHQAPYRTSPEPTATVSTASTPNKMPLDKNVYAITCVLQPLEVEVTPPKGKRFGEKSAAEPVVKKVKERAEFSKEQKLAFLEDCQNTHLTIAEYAKANKLGNSTLYRWAVLYDIPLRTRPEV